jgi:hypothetical protein
LGFAPTRKCARDHRQKASPWNVDHIPDVQHRLAQLDRVAFDIDVDPGRLAAVLDGQANGLSIPSLFHLYSIKRAELRERNHNHKTFHERTTGNLKMSQNDLAGDTQKSRKPDRRSREQKRRASYLNYRLSPRARDLFAPYRTHRGSVT